MTPKELYNQLYSNSFPLYHFTKSDKRNTIIANIVHNNTNQIKSQHDAINLLEKYNIFAIPSAHHLGFDVKSVKPSDLHFEIRFHYDIDEIDCYSIDVDDIDEIAYNGQSMIFLVCKDYILVQSIHKNNQEKNEDKKKDCTQKQESPSSKSGNIFRDFFNIIPEFVRKCWNTDDCETKTCKGCAGNCDKSNENNFFSFTYTLNSNGDVNLKASSNKGDIEKNFNINDEYEDEYKCESIDDDEQCDDSDEDDEEVNNGKRRINIVDDTKKAELRDLIGVF